MFGLAENRSRTKRTYLWVGTRESSSASRAKNRCCRVRPSSYASPMRWRVKECFPHVKEQWVESFFLQGLGKLSLLSPWGELGSPQPVPS